MTDVTVPAIVEADHIAKDINDRGLHLFDPDSIPWAPPVRRPNSHDPAEHGQGVLEKWLVKPDADDPANDRFPISIVKFPPNFVFPKHWHTEGEMLVILKGTANFAGKIIGPGAICYNDARTIYGAEAAGPEGCEFLMVRRAYARTTVVGD
jgi:hypothetical protein